jgi:hypothetical protein
MSIIALVGISDKKNATNGSYTCEGDQIMRKERKNWEASRNELVSQVEKYQKSPRQGQ